MAPTTSPLYQGVVIDASASAKTPADLSAMKIQWAVEGPSGSLAELRNKATLTPSFTPDAPGLYKLTLTITRGEQKASKTHALTVANLLGLPVYLGQPWKEVLEVGGKVDCESKSDPLVARQSCSRSPTRGDPASWAGFQAQSIKEGRVTTVIVHADDQEAAEHDSGHCAGVIRSWGSQLEELGLKQVAEEEGRAKFESSFGVVATILCSASGSMNSLMFLSFAWTDAKPTGSCPSLKEAPKLVRYLANLSIGEAMALTQGRNVADPGTDCNHDKTPLGPGGMGGLTYAWRRVNNTRTAFKSVGTKLSQTAPDWLVRQIVEGLGTVPPVDDSASPIARSTWDQAIKDFSRPENLQALWLSSAQPKSKK